MKVHYPHPFDPKWKAIIHRIWSETRFTKCPIKSDVEEKEYAGTFVEYTYIDKKKRKIYVEEYCLLVKWV
ncbi:hypothetical protein fHeYen901_124 [Yersinia phage fHe-Yen9-01]|uniref:DUF7202 domain-containing protein n=1 Tax=Yersinia phage fHe-Yen9-01 TaxID=1965363 RepID=A0A1V0DXM0_9CAUD|nr:hypothetical protein KNT60_gp123 [Yersinia phage fHe-Yen9-01]ARB05897.1 hypothetical protein fHeYen901_124 [Yersinia phage fHe-Yen9-01]